MFSDYHLVSAAGRIRASLRDLCVLPSSEIGTSFSLRYCFPLSAMGRPAYVSLDTFRVPNLSRPPESGVTLEDSQFPEVGMRILFSTLSAGPRASFPMFALRSSAIEGAVFLGRNLRPGPPRGQRLAIQSTEGDF